MGRIILLISGIAVAVSAAAFGLSAESLPLSCVDEIKQSGSWYSPYSVDVAGSDIFHSISFKDVGSTESLPGENSAERLQRFEALAQALGKNLKSQSLVSLDAEVIYDPAATAPESHCSCEGHHAYVDIWRSSEPSRWGYSLWSGCDEGSQFGWHELPADGIEPANQGRTNSIPAIDGLAQSISLSLTEAMQKRCVRSEC